MVFDLIPIRPNPREQYQNQVEALCQLLKDEKGSIYRVPVFTSLLTIPGSSFKRRGYKRFRDHPQAKRFLRLYRLDTMAQTIMSELDKIYDKDPNEIDHLRGAVAEVFSYFICRKTYPKTDIEVQVKIGSWVSGSIDTAGCSNERGHCIQSKCSLEAWKSIINQKRDFDQIETLTKGKAEGVFVTFVDRGAFFTRLRNAGLNPDEFSVWDRADLFVLEKRLVQ